VIGGLAGINIEEEAWSSAGVIPAVELALERVNNHSDILKDYYLDIEWKDSRVCSL
jgi:gamma-aminobutyric acid type B receptor